MPRLAAEDTFAFLRSSLPFLGKLLPRATVGCAFRKEKKKKTTKKTLYLLSSREFTLPPLRQPPAQPCITTPSSHHFQVSFVVSRFLSQHDILINKQLKKATWQRPYIAYSSNVRLVLSQGHNAQVRPLVCVPGKHESYKSSSKSLVAFISATAGTVLEHFFYWLCCRICHFPDISMSCLCKLRE